MVVQITMVPSSTDFRPKACASLACSANGKATSTAGSTRSAYSTSASASAEPQSKHQFTGFRPRNT
ncbi:hypothetical protein D3C85_1927700 [compost metagenome]